MKDDTSPQVILSKHAENKIRFLKEHGFPLTERQVVETVMNPDKVLKGKEGRLVCQKIINKKHVLRVIYEKHKGLKWVVTVYPARRERYES